VALQFDPVWTSPNGHHLWHLNLDPWDHLLLNEVEMVAKIRRHGGTEADIKISISEMNRKSGTEHRDLIERFGRAYFSQFHLDWWERRPEQEPATAHPNFERANRAWLPGGRSVCARVQLRRRPRRVAAVP
jgi:hypothetical protein